MRYIVVIILTLFFQYSANAQKQKIIFDCDLGGDIDDAYAGALLLTGQEEFEILGITPDHGNTPGRAAMACKILYKKGMEHIPVYMGDHTPTIVGEQTELEGLSTQMIWSNGFDELLPQREHAAISMRNSPLTDAISSLYALWYRHADGAVSAKIFDAVAIGMVLWPELFTTREAHVYLDDKGFTKLDDNKEPNCHIGITIRGNEFIDKMALRILHQNLQR